LQGLLSDITEQKLAEAALRDSETRYRTIFESAGDAILLSKDETLVDCSARALDLFHCTRTQLIGQSVLSLSPAFQPDGSDSKQSVLETIQRVLSKGSESFEWQFQRRDGTLFYSEFRLTCLELAGEVYLLGVVRDTTEYRRAEETLVRLRQAVNASGEVVFMTDREGVFTFVNPEFTRLYGYTEAEVLGQATPRILRSGMIDAAHYARFWDTLRQKRVARGEISNKTKDGRLVSVASSVNPVLNEKGDIAAYLAIQRDVSERKRLEEQYLQAQKMEAVGRLAAGVAHDFNNLLTIINGYSDLLLERLPADDPARDSVAEIKGAGERATGLTRQLLAFSRQQIRTSRVLDLNALVATSIKMLRRLIGEDVELVFIPGGDLDMIKADPGQIEQVLMNLAVNARDAMLRGGKLTIETSNFLADQAYSSSHYPMPPGSYVMLAVSDTGQGMDAETQARIFEPFFTTKGQGKGTGLGLPTVYGIVKQSAGYTWVYSELGQGTTFKIYLPAAEGTPDAAKAIGAVAGGSETVLLVEDEAKLRSLARSVLESRGYKVLEARTSMEALLIPSQYQGPIHLLLTDVVMPALSGRELAEKLTKLHPELKILFMSGYTDDTVVRHGVLESGMAYLQKPFSPDALARKVREVLDAQKPSS
jgi:PAS domain S-box-containing protein